MQSRSLASLFAAVIASAWVTGPQAASAQTEFQSRHFTTSDSVRLHYLEAGSGPTLVFVPGWTMPAWIWEPQIEHFASDYRIVALDPRGQGESEAGGCDQTLASESAGVGPGVDSGPGRIDGGRDGSPAPHAASRSRR